MITEPYNRIPCGVYDQLEIVAMRQTASTIRYRDESGNECTLKEAIIVNLKSIEKVEFAILKSGQKIRLDWIIQLNDLVIQDQKGCYSSFDTTV